MTRSRVLGAVAVVLLLVGGLVGATWQLVADDEHDDGPGPWVQRAERDWPGWAATHMDAGRPGSALASATGDFSGNDWGVDPTFGWRLTFRADRLVTPQQVRQTLRSACAFPPVQDREVRLEARLATPGIEGPVRTDVSSDCDRPVQVLTRWLRHLDGHPLPRQVRNATVTVVAEPQLQDADEEELVVFVFVRPSAATRATARSIRQNYCAFPGRLRLTLHLRSLGAVRPAAARRRWAVEEPLLAFRPADPQSCAAVR